MLVVPLLLLTLYQIAKVECFNLKPMHVIARRDQLTYADKELIGFFVCYDKCEKNSSCTTFSYFAPNGRCAEADFSRPRKVGEIRGKRNDNSTCDLTTARETSTTSKSTSIDTSSTSEITPMKTTTTYSPTTPETTLISEDTQTLLTTTTPFKTSTTVDITTTTNEISTSLETTLTASQSTSIDTSSTPEPTTTTDTTSSFETTEFSTSDDPTWSTSEKITEQSTTTEQSTITEPTLSTIDVDTTTTESTSASTTTKTPCTTKPPQEALIEIRTWHKPGPELICHRELFNCKFLRDFNKMLDGPADSYDNGLAIRLDRLDVINTTCSCDPRLLRVLCFKYAGNGFQAELFPIDSYPTDWCLGIVATQNNTCGSFWRVGEVSLGGGAFKYMSKLGIESFWLFKQE